MSPRTDATGRGAGRIYEKKESAGAVMGMSVKEARSLLKFMVDHNGILMECIVVLILLLASWWIILSQNYGPVQENFACGIIGAIMGYYLHKSKSSVSRI
jgi:hypothetical protein